MGLFDSIGKMVGNIKGQQQAGKRAAQAEKDYWKRIEAGNWEPEYASEHAPGYQQTKSPVARAYLESFLTGDNPDAVQGTRAGSSGPLGTKAVAQNQFNQAYGGWDKLQAQSAAELGDNQRFQPTPVSRPVRDETTEAAARYPWSKDWETKLGRPLTPQELELVNKWRGGSSISIDRRMADSLLKNGTAEQIASALRSGSDSALGAMASLRKG
jgi:hypothetical protein